MGESGALSGRNMSTPLMRNPNAKHIDFKDFKGIIKGAPNVVPSDLDMQYERNGHFLLGEWKRENEQISLGQKIALKAWARVPQITVLLIYGNTDNETKINKIYKITKEGRLKYLGEGLPTLQELINKWWTFANRKR